MPRERSLTSRERGARASVGMGRGLKYLNCTPPAPRERAESWVLNRPLPPQPLSGNKDSTSRFLRLPAGGEETLRVPPSEVRA